MMGRVDDELFVDVLVAVVVMGLVELGLGALGGPSVIWDDGGTVSSSLLLVVSFWLDWLLSAGLKLSRYWLDWAMDASMVGSLHSYAVWFIEPQL